MKRRIRSLFRLPLLPALSLILLACFTVLWVRGYRQTDDWFVIYRAGGSEHLRSWRGYLILRHKAPDGEVPRQGIERVSHHAVRTNSLPPDVGLSPGKVISYPKHRRWGPVTFDAGDGLPLQTAKAAYQASLQRPALPSARVMLFQMELKRLEREAPPAVGPDGPADARQRWIENQQARANLQSTITHETTLAAQAPRSSFVAPEGSRWQLAFPAWLGTAASGLLALPWVLLRLRARRRRRTGLCARCGYDLRAGHDRCPECGDPVPVASKREQSIANVFVTGAA